VSTRITLRVGIHPEQGRQRYRERRLFPGLAHRRLFDALPDIHKSAGDGPAKRRVAAFNQHYRPSGAVRQLNNNVSSQQRRHG